MKTTTAIAVAILSLTAFQSQAAQTYVGATRNTMHIALSPSSSAGLSREQVKAELAAARASGELVANAESGLKFNQLYPSQYPAAPIMAGKTRAQVNAELASAVRTGDMMADAQSGLKLNEVYPSQYPATQVLAGTNREQVKAELALAQLSGNFPAAGEITGTCVELHPNMHPTH